MSDSRTRPTRKTNTRQAAVGRNAGGNNLPVLFIVAVVSVVLAFVILLTVAADWFAGDDPPASPAVDPTPTSTAEATPAGSTATAVATAAPTEAPTAQPTLSADGSIELACGDILAPLDKQHVLPSNCVPPDLEALPAQYSSGLQQMRSAARAAIIEMFEAANKEGYLLYANSTYRSYSEQSATYDYWVRQNGKEYADRTSARPGHSEHQLGTTADVGWSGCELECTIGSPEAAWIAANSYRFGFIVSYPDGKESITGYAAEPWHVRFVGKDVAQQVVNSGLTLHEFLLR